MNKELQEIETLIEDLHDMVDGFAEEPDEYDFIRIWGTAVLIVILMAVLFVVIPTIRGWVMLGTCAASFVIGIFVLIILDIIISCPANDVDRQLSDADDKLRRGE